MVFVVLWATMKLLSTTSLASVNFPLVDLGIDAWLCLNISSVMVIYIRRWQRFSFTRSRRPIELRNS